MSGYPDVAATSSLGLLGPDINYIPKPFKEATLLEALERVLSPPDAVSSNQLAAGVGQRP
jgi:hypothetical protein